MPHKNVGPPDLPKGPANDNHKGECFAPLTNKTTLKIDFATPMARVKVVNPRVAKTAS